VRGKPPAGARLGLYRHGDTVSERAALELLARPDFPDSWVILPSADGAGLTLAWGDACRSKNYNGLPPGTPCSWPTSRLTACPLAAPDLPDNLTPSPAPVFPSPGHAL